jgi:hypothetical protein
VPTPTAEDVARAEKILEVEKYNNKPKLFTEQYLKR